MLLYAAIVRFVHRAAERRAHAYRFTHKHGSKILKTTNSAGAGIAKPLTARKNNASNCFHFGVDLVSADVRSELEFFGFSRYDVALK